MSKTKRDRVRYLLRKTDINWDSLSHKEHNMAYPLPRCARYWRRWSYKKLRDNTKKLIREEKWDDIVSKPENVDWIIW